MKKNNKIFLTGFMTSGKSTIGPILANVLGWDFYDLDKVIEEKMNDSIVNIFEDKGEEYFRKLESEELQKLIERENVVISLGGGTFAIEANRIKILDSGYVIYLRVSPEILYKRLKNKIDRPLFRDLVLGEKSEREFINRIRTLLEAREVDYNKADLIINTDQTKVGITVDKLAKQIKKVLYAKN